MARRSRPGGRVRAIASGRSRPGDRVRAIASGRLRLGDRDLEIASGRSLPDDRVWRSRPSKLPPSPWRPRCAGSGRSTESGAARFASRHRPLIHREGAAAARTMSRVDLRSNTRIDLDRGPPRLADRGPTPSLAGQPRRSLCPSRRPELPPSPRRPTAGHLPLPRALDGRITGPAGPRRA